MPKSASIGSQSRFLSLLSHFSPQEFLASVPTKAAAVLPPVGRTSNCPPTGPSRHDLHIDPHFPPAPTSGRRHKTQIDRVVLQATLLPRLIAPAKVRPFATTNARLTYGCHFSHGATANSRAPTIANPGSQRLDGRMASDEDYMNFLDKANRDPNEGVTPKAQGAKAQFKTTDHGASVPEPLVTATRDAFYVSDADEPFVPVALTWDEGGKGLPDEEEFAQLIQHWDPKAAEIEILDPVDWDTQGQYGDVIEAVRQAGKGNDVRVYRVKKDSTRAEYWVVTTEGKGKSARLVGAKALAVES
ncbi:hypothetical protein GQ53DRAFT_749260 [Thozetella sp. PMI_491]|nr:hypothetical protein GQ53DRAFT_749260 [Thozetella sp. PMI_491]